MRSKLSPNIATGWVLERRKTCVTSVRPLYEISIALPLRHRQVISRQKNHAPLASLTGGQVMYPSVYAGQKTRPVASLAGKKVRPCSAFAGQETLCLGVHGFARPHYSRLSEMSSFALLRYRASASRELRTRDHRNNEVTGQSSRHGASRMRQTVRTDAPGFGATPPRNAPIFIKAGSSCRHKLGGPGKNSPVCVVGCTSQHHGKSSSKGPRLMSRPFFADDEAWMYYSR